MAESEKIKISTPVGVLNWVQISGQGKLNYNKDGYEYVATVRLEGKAAEELKAEIDAIYDSESNGKLKLRSKGYREVVDDDGKPTGEVDFQFRTKTTYADGKPSVIKVFNKDAREVSLGDRKIGNGSIGAIAGQAKYYINGKEDGVSLFLKHVQITKFVPYVEDAGFSKVDGDFEDFTDGDGDFPEGEAPQEKEQASPQPAKPTAKPRL